MRWGLPKYIYISLQAATQQGSECVSVPISPALCHSHAVPLPRCATPTLCHPHAVPPSRCTTPALCNSHAVPLSCWIRIRMPAEGPHRPCQTISCLPAIGAFLLLAAGRMFWTAGTRAGIGACASPRHSSRAQASLINRRHTKPREAVPVPNPKAPNPRYQGLPCP
jgi:hypothetical protein